jgi:[glutamine synthetase] adenylyltransferase / [glutamine synthetase]-adenylyl-L-tyrosine phosphorylase
VRVEQERIPPGEDPQFHLKLGKGALTDVEFAVQLLQLQHCGTVPGIRTPATTDGIGRLVAADLLAAEDGAALEEAYRFCERARNARYLILGQPGDALPGGADDVRIGRLLGFTHQPQTELRDEFRRVTRRARRVVDRVFYGRTT